MTIYAAHIVTSEATALGDPEIIIMTQADETGTAEEIERFPLTDDHKALDELCEHGYTLVPTPTEVATGYVIWDVEKD